MKPSNYHDIAEYSSYLINLPVFCLLVDNVLTTELILSTIVINGNYEKSDVQDSSL